MTTVHPEIAIVPSLIYDEQPTKEWLRIATPMDGMIDSDNVPHLPKLGRALGLYFLETYWSYPDAEQTPIIPGGKRGTYDGGMIMGTATQPIIDTNAIHWYYTGAQHTHGLDLKDRYKAIGRVTWRLDGFVSLDADKGVVETVPLYIPSGNIYINAATKGGSVGVEVLSSTGQIQSGFSLDDCSLLTGDSTRHRIQWKSSVDGERTLSDACQPLRFRFVLNRAQLYSFCIN